jgi:esterase/lipase superfamily enzyme
MTWQSCRSVAACAFVLAVAWGSSAAAADAPAPARDSTVGMGRIVPLVQTVTEKIFFVTNRKRTDSKLPSEQFSGERAAATSFGLVRVAVASMVADDSAFSPTTQGVKSLSWAEISNKLSKAPRILLVVHGFNNTFDEAAAMAALLKRNLRTDAAVLMLSWPSRGSRFSYFSDEEEVELATGMMASVLTDIAQIVGVSKLQIFAHSLGTRLTVNALRRIFDSPQRSVLGRISQLVLAAPDVNRVWMDLEFVPVLEYVRIPTTIYVSAPDAWIGLSELIHQHARVGSFWDHSIYLQTLLTTVDLSAVEGAGHSVVFSPGVTFDLYFVLERELPPEQRPWLWKTELAKGIYWHLLPQLIRP